MASRQKFKETLAKKGISFSGKIKPGGTPFFGPGKGGERRRDEFNRKKALNDAISSELDRREEERRSGLQAAAGDGSEGTSGLLSGKRKKRKKRSNISLAG